MKKRVIEITNCRDCPHFVYGVVACEEDDSIVLNVLESKDSVPENCPLPTISDYCESNFDIDKEP